MKLECHACQARYTLADHKVRGKIVKIRCKRCGAIVVADGALLERPPPVADEPPAPLTPLTPERPVLPGERHEQSVLFSLSALSAVAAARAPVETPKPAPTASSDSSGLIDIRMLAQGLAPDRAPRAASDDVAHLGSGGVFASTLLEPAPWPPRSDARSWTRARALRPLTLGALGVALVVGLSVALARGTAAPRPPPPPSVTAAAPLAPAAPIASTRTAAPAIAPEEAKPSPAPIAADARVRPAAAPPSKPPPAASVEAAAAPPVVSRRCCPGESDTTCEMRIAVGAGCRAQPAEAPPAFDSASAARALAAVDLRGCARTAGAAGAGHVRVTFQPGGNVSDVVADTPGLAGTPAERCVADAYRRVRVAAFSGQALTVGKRFTMPAP